MRVSNQQDKMQFDSSLLPLGLFAGFHNLRWVSANDRKISFKLCLINLHMIVSEERRFSVREQTLRQSWVVRSSTFSQEQHETTIEPFQTTHSIRYGRRNTVHLHNYAYLEYCRISSSQRHEKQSP